MVRHRPTMPSSAALPTEQVGPENLRLRRNCRYFGTAMSRAIHVFRSPDRFVAGTVGQPGNRTFYLQAVHEARAVSVVLEKQQVAVLAERIDALLVEVNRRFGTPVPPETGQVEDLSPLITPVDAEFRGGTMGLGWESEAQTVVGARRHRGGALPGPGVPNTGGGGRVPHPVQCRHFRGPAAVPALRRTAG